MAEIATKMANATPQEFAFMRSQVDAQINKLNAAQMLKQKGNELHSHGKFNDALENYSRAKNNLKSIPSPKGGTLLLACSLNLMSCYLKTNQYDECIKEGIENAVLDLKKTLEFSPDDETIANVLRDAKEKLTEHGGKDATRGLKIEEITDEVSTPSSEMHETAGAVEFGSTMLQN